MSPHRTVRAPQSTPGRTPRTRPPGVDALGWLRRGDRSAPGAASRNPGSRGEPRRAYPGILGLYKNSYETAFRRNSEVRVDVRTTRRTRARGESARVRGVLFPTR